MEGERSGISGDKRRDETRRGQKKSFFFRTARKVQPKGPMPKKMQVGGKGFLAIDDEDLRRPPFLLKKREKTAGSIFASAVTEGRKERAGVREILRISDSVIVRFSPHPRLPRPGPEEHREGSFLIPFLDSIFVYIHPSSQ